MAYDLALSENGDLIFSAIRDLQGIAGVGQINQRIRTRLKIPLSTWVYDDDGNLGSQLYTLSTMNPNEAQVRTEAYVRESLRQMDDISVDSVELVQDANGFVVNVFYRLTAEADEFTTADLGPLSLTIPVEG